MTMGRGRWEKRTCHVVVVEGPLQQAAAGQHHVAVVLERLVISISRMRSVRSWRDTPLIKSLTLLSISLSLTAAT
jgi:hypothetical protein